MTILYIIHVRMPLLLGEEMASPLQSPLGLIQVSGMDCLRAIPISSKSPR
jgi:hypothetical protein